METEKRLIDANALRKKSIWGKIRQGTVYETDAKVVTTGVIDQMPTVDAVEVVHSRWVNIVNVADAMCLGFCENCRTEQKAQNATALKVYHKYCRWCGAKMDGDGNEDV